MQRLCIAALLFSAVAAQRVVEPKLGDGRKPLTGPGFEWDARHPLGPDFMPGEPAVPPPEGLRGNTRPGPNRRPMVPSPVFKVDGVTFQSTTAVPLETGETMFRMIRPRDGEEEPRPEEGRRRARRNLQYVKLSYNKVEPNKVSIEFGLLKPVRPGELVRVEDIVEEDY